jgi:hypothetical protein
VSAGISEPASDPRARLESEVALVERRKPLERARSLWSRWRPRSPAEVAVFAVWLCAALAVICCAEGLHPLTFLSPDEALNRFASRIISRTGRPFLELPFPDPEDVAHPRAWLSVGRVAIPIYPPVSLYLYALFTFLKAFWLIVLWPATGLAAFAAGTARLLPADRRWLGLLAPALATPALYWQLRPWMNISSLLTCLCWALFAWAHWREKRRSGWLAAALLCVGAGAAVRPDYTAYLLPIAALFSLAVDPRDWKRIALFTFLAGAGALVVNLVLNHLVTGHAFKAAYQLSVEQDEGPSSEPAWLRLVRVLVLPMGLPSLHMLGRLFWRYWIEMKPLALLLLAQLSLVPLLYRTSLRSVALVLAATLLLCLLMVSRMDPNLFGALEARAAIHDSIPRYWTPVYLLAALPPLLLVGRLRGPALAGGSLALAALAGFSIYQVAWRMGHTDQRHLREAREDLASLSAHVPRDALVYTPNYDKVLWSHAFIGTALELKPAAKSMRRALDNGYDTYLWLPPKPDTQLEDFEDALEAVGLKLVKADRKLQFYRVVAPPT